MNNITTEGKADIIKWSQPDYDNPITITLPASDNTYTVPYTGVLSLTMPSTGNWVYVWKGTSNSGTMIASLRQYGQYGGYDTINADVVKGDVLYVHYNGSFSQQVIFPYKGA